MSRTESHRDVNPVTGADLGAGPGAGSTTGTATHPAGGASNGSPRSR